MWTFSGVISFVKKGFSHSHGGTALIAFDQLGHLYRCRGFDAVWRCVGDELPESAVAFLEVDPCHQIAALPNVQFPGTIAPPLDGVASLAFGWPEPADAYLGLMLLDPQARGQGLGPHLLPR